jgi:sporulation protein YlmC with PRC-barrel domain
MGIYLGNIGNVEIARRSIEDGLTSIVNPSDVNASRNRFSFDFDEGCLISGDLVEITATDGTNLDFIDASGWGDATVQSSGDWYVFIDELGGIRLYNNFDDSLEGSAAGLVPLAVIARDIPISVKVQDRSGRLLACVTDYELNTNRETVDITALSDRYREQYSSLITGSGQITAQWDYVNEAGQEPVHYLMQLVLRTEIGSGLHLKLYVKSADTDASGGSFSATQLNDALWWEFDALITNSATSFAPGDIIVSTIDFVATGAIKLRARTTTPSRLLQEAGDPILLEQGGYLLLEGEDAA